MEWYHGQEFIDQELEVIPFYIHPIIPGDGVVLFHGSPGIGKSTVMWQIANHLHDGLPFMGMKVVQTKVLLLNLDMPKVGVHNRWKESGFEPKFDLAFDDGFNCLKAGFQASETYKKLKELHEQEQYGVVIVDALGRVINGSVNNDELPNQVYSCFTQWFPHSAIIFIHHDRKRKQKDDGSLAAATEEDFLGSQYWKSFAAIQLHLYKVNDQILRLHHVKSQLGVLMDEELNLFMNEGGTKLEEWTEVKQAEEAHLLMECEVMLRQTHPEWNKYNLSKKIRLMGDALGKSQATIYRWRKSLNVVKGVDIGAMK